MNNANNSPAIPLLSVSTFNVEQWKHKLTGFQASISLSNRSLDASYGISYKNESMTTEADQTLTIVTICFLSALASILTIGGNVMVIVSFVINRSLRTVNNYLILSLAAADLVIGVVSMNLFTVFIVSGSWKLGAVLCDVWLALDYVASNASVMNLLIICLDRYYSVTKPVEYRNQRTPKRFITAIIGAWSISFILWAPWVLFWQFIVNKRTVPEDNCYVQFIKDSKPMAVITAIGAFYLPATVMCVLYWKVYIGIKNRRKKLLRMKEIKVAKDNSIISGSEDEHQSNSSDGHCRGDSSNNPNVHIFGKGLKARMRHFFQHKRDFSAPNENNCLLDDKKVGPVTEGIEISQYVVKSLNGAQSIPTGEVSAINRLDTNNKEDQIQDHVVQMKHLPSTEVYKNENTVFEEEPAEPPQNVLEHDPHDDVFISDNQDSSELPLSPHNVLKNYDVGNDNVEPLRSTSSDVVNGKQTLVAVVRQRHGYIEEKVATTNIDKNTMSEFEHFDSTNGSLVLENNQRKNSTNSTKVKNKRRKLPSIPKDASPMTPLTNKFLESVGNGTNKITSLALEKRRPSNREEIQFGQVVTDILCKREAKSNEEPTYTEGRTSLTSAATSASYHNIPTLQHRSPEKHPENASQTGGDSPRSRTNSGRLLFIRRQIKKAPDTDSNLDSGGIIKVTERLKLQVVKKKLQSLNKETKAARLLASILAAFILLWLPYNIMALVEAFCPLAEKCIPDLAWNFGYWFCYLNSTLNPVCYAMCNKNFQQTFKFLLSMKWIKPENRRYRAPVM